MIPIDPTDSEHQDSPEAPSAQAVPSFDALYAESADFVWRSLRRLGVAPSALEDALQDVFLVVHRRLREFEGRASIKTWLFRIAMNVAREQRRRAGESARVDTQADVVATDERPTPFEQAVADERLRTLLSILDDLDDDDRALFVLVELEEASVVDAAAILGINLNTTYTRLRSARRKFTEAAAKRRLGRNGPARGERE